MSTCSEELMTEADVDKRASWRQGEAHRMAQMGLIPGIRQPDGSYRFRLSDMVLRLGWKEPQKTATPPQPNQDQPKPPPNPAANPQREVLVRAFIVDSHFCWRPGTARKKAWAKEIPSTEAGGDFLFSLTEVAKSLGLQPPVLTKYIPAGGREAAPERKPSDPVIPTPGITEFMSAEAIEKHLGLTPGEVNYMVYRGMVSSYRCEGQAIFRLAQIADHLNKRLSPNDYAAIEADRKNANRKKRPDSSGSLC